MLNFYRIREVQLQDRKYQYIAERRVFIFFWSKWFIDKKTKSKSSINSSNKERVKKFISEMTCSDTRTTFKNKTKQN